MFNLLVQLHPMVFILQHLVIIILAVLGFFWFDSPLYGWSVSNRFIKTGALSTDFLMGNDDLNSTAYVISADTQVINSVPFINSSGNLFSDNSNLYVPRGSSIQTAINQRTSGQGYSIQLASGAYTETMC